MNPSPLLLDNYFFKEITVKHLSGVKSDNKIVADDLKVNVREMHDDDTPREWIFELTIELPESATPKLPYTFRIVLVGFFEVSETYQSTLAGKLARANGPAILYSATREMLAILTGRGFGATIILPSVNFLPPTQEQSAAEKETEKAAVVKPKSAKRVRKTTKKKTT